MTRSEDSEKPSSPERDEWKFPSWKRVGEFVANVLQLERSVASLKDENRQLREELTKLQRQLDEQGGRLEILTDFVRTAVHEQVDARAEKAAIRAVETMAALVRSVSREIE